MMLLNENTITGYECNEINLNHEEVVMKDNVKVLIVDDSKIYQMMIQDTLSDYKTVVAADGVEALEVLMDQQDIDVVVLDINMPRMNGFQVLERIESDMKERELSVIILTNNDEIDDELKGLSKGAVDYIRKPLNGPSLLKRVEVHLNLVFTRKKLNLYRRALIEATGNDLLNHTL